MWLYSRSFYAIDEELSTSNFTPSASSYNSLSSLVSQQYDHFYPVIRPEPNIMQYNSNDFSTIMNSTTTNNSLVPFYYSQVPSQPNHFVSYPNLWLDFQNKCRLMLQHKQRQTDLNLAVKDRSKETVFSSHSQIHLPLEQSIMSETLSKTYQAIDTSNTTSECHTEIPLSFSLTAGKMSVDTNEEPSNTSLIYSSSSSSLLSSPPSATTLQDIHQSSRSPKSNRLVCSKCQRTFSTLTGLNKHVQQKHICDLSMVAKQKMYPRALDVKNLSATTLNQTTQHQYSCQHCSKLYHSLSALKMHIRTHTLPCKCHICGKAFSRMWLLNGHLRTHSGEKPFSCHICARAFADRSNLRAHLQTHTRVKRYRCLEGCGRTFSRMALLTKHRGSNGSCAEDDWIVEEEEEEEELNLGAIKTNT